MIVISRITYWTLASELCWRLSFLQKVRQKSAIILHYVDHIILLWRNSSKLPVVIRVLGEVLCSCLFCSVWVEKRECIDRCHLSFSVSTHTVRSFTHIRTPRLPISYGRAINFLPTFFWAIAFAFLGKASASYFLLIMDIKLGRVCGVLKSANNGLGMHSTRIYADSI